MKKALTVFVISLTLVLLFCVYSYAYDITEDYGSVYKAVESSTEELLREAGIDGVDYSSLVSLSGQRLFNVIKDLFTGNAETPLKTGARVIAVIIMFAVINALKTESSGNEGYYSFVEKTAVLITVIIPLSSALSSAVGATVASSNFMFSFIPVFTAFVSASGKPASSYLYSASMLGFASACNGFCANLFMPLIAVFTSINIFGALEENLNLSRITATAKKLITVTLSVSASLFVGLTNLKATLAFNADSLALKGVRMAAGSFVPVIGNAIGEAVNSTFGALGLMKSTFGVFGIIAVAFSFAPFVVELVIWYIVLTMCCVVADALGSKPSGEILSALLGCVSTVNIILVLCALVFILTTGNMLRG